MSSNTRAAPIAGIVVQGSTGEAILLSDEERREVLKSAREAAANDKVLIAGTGIESATETLRLTEYAAELGYDVAMVRTPHYYKGQMAQPANMLAFYRFVCDRSPLPVIIYNFPQATGYDIPAEVVIELAEHPNLIGIKESSGSIEKVQKMVEGTRHIKRSATVTETFAAVTGRMLKAAAAASASAEGGALVSVGALAGTAAPKPSPSAVTVVGELEDAAEGSWLPGVWWARRTSCILRSTPEPSGRSSPSPIALRPLVTKSTPPGKTAMPYSRARSRSALPRLQSALSAH